MKKKQPIFTNQRLLFCCSLLATLILLSSCVQEQSTLSTSTLQSTSTPIQTLTLNPTYTPTPTPTPTPLGGGTGLLTLYFPYANENGVSCCQAFSYDMTGDLVNPRVDTGNGLYSFFGELSPDGSRSAHIIYPEDGTQHLLVVDSTTMETQVDNPVLDIIKSTPQFAYPWRCEVAWLADGNTLLIMIKPEYYGTGFVELFDDFYTYNLDTGTTTLLIKGVSEGAQPQYNISSDGKWMIYRGKDDYSHIVAMDGSSNRVLVKSFNYLPFFTNDPDNIYWVQPSYFYNDNNQRLLKFNINTLESELLEEGDSLVGYGGGIGSNQCFELKNSIYLYCGFSKIDMSQNPIVIQKFLDAPNADTTLDGYFLSPDKTKVFLRLGTFIQYTNYGTTEYSYYIFDSKTNSVQPLNDLYFDYFTDPWSPDSRLVTGYYKTEFESSSKGETIHFVFYDTETGKVTLEIPFIMKVDWEGVKHIEW